MKDRASALLASRLDVDLFLISTDTDYVYLNYKNYARTDSLSEPGGVAGVCRCRSLPTGQYGTQSRIRLTFCNA